jgi:hypothetical protein
MDLLPVKLVSPKSVSSNSSRACGIRAIRVKQFGPPSFSSFASVKDCPQIENHHRPVTELHFAAKPTRKALKMNNVTL